MKKKTILLMLMIFLFAGCEEEEPTFEITPSITVELTDEATYIPSVEISGEPVPESSITPTNNQSVEKTPEPTVELTEDTTIEPTPTPTIEPSIDPTPEPKPEMPSIDLSVPADYYCEPLLISHTLIYNSYNAQHFVVLDDYADMVELYEFYYNVYKLIDVKEYTPNYFEKNFLILFLTVSEVTLDNILLDENTLKINVSSTKEIKRRKNLISYYEPLPEYHIKLNELRLCKSKFDINRDYGVYIDGYYLKLSYSTSMDIYKMSKLFYESYGLEKRYYCLNKLYGKQNYSIYLFDYNEKENEIIKIGNETIKLNDNQSIYVYNNGNFSSLYFAYSEGIIDIDIIKEIKDAYYWFEYLDEFEDTYEKRFNKNDTYLELYYGTHDDKMVGFFLDEKKATPWSETIDDVQVNYKDSRNMYVFNLTNIYTLKEAYDNNIISKDTLVSIVNKYNEHEFQYLHYYYEDVFSNNDPDAIKEIQFRYINEINSNYPYVHNVKYTQNRSSIDKLYEDMLYVKCYEKDNNSIDFIYDYYGYSSSYRYYYNIALLTDNDIFEFTTEDEFIYNGKVIVSNLSDRVYPYRYDNLSSGKCFFENAVEFNILDNSILQIKDFSYIVFNTPNGYSSKKYLTYDLTLNGMQSNIELGIINNNTIKVIYYENAQLLNFVYQVVGYKKIDDVENYLKENDLDFSYKNVKLLLTTGIRAERKYDYYINKGKTYSKQEFIDLLDSLNIKVTDISLTKDFTDFDEFTIQEDMKIYYTKD